MIQFTFIRTQEQLNQLAQVLTQEKIIAIDIECENSLHHYGTYTALIQVSTKNQNWIIDVLSCTDLNVLKPIFRNQDIVKIIHDVSFDLRILNHQYGIRFKNLFDTQLAALLLGHENIGLASLLEKYFNVKKEKKFQRVDWTRRPLTQEMLAYAIGDTAYLIELKEMLEKELIEKRRVNWVKQECEYIESINFTFNEQRYIDVSGVKRMSPKERSIFKVLFEERDSIAQKLDKPPFFIISNKQLIAFSQNPPYNVNSWKKLKRVHPLVKQQAAHFHRLVQEAAKREDVIARKEYKKLSKEQSMKVKKLTEHRNNIAEKLGIKGHLIANTEQLRDIIVNNSYNGLRDWQKELLLS